MTPHLSQAATFFGHGDPVRDVRTGARGRLQIPRPTPAERATGLMPVAEVVWEGHPTTTSELDLVIDHLEPIHPIELAGGGG